MVSNNIARDIIAIIATQLPKRLTEISWWTKSDLEKEWKFYLICDDSRDVGDIIQYGLYADAHSFALILGKFL